jgi:hypothetical protein
MNPEESMNNRGTSIQQTTVLFAALSCIALSAIGGADSAKRGGNIADQELFFGTVPKAVCGPGDKPEMALQGQVPIALRTQSGGYQGNSCNLQLIGQVRGEGANWQTTEWREGRGQNKKVCAYHGTAAPTYAPSAPYLPRQAVGVRVIDISDPTKPVNTAYLQTSAMLDPWESLKVNQRRQVLGGVNAQNGGLNTANGGPEIDIYDVDGDCRFPQLLTSTPVVAPDGHPIFGHEGNWAPDGLTYYGSDIQYVGPNAAPNNRGQWYAIDTTDLTKPKYVHSWMTGVPGATIHGLSVREDGLRGYMTSIGNVSVGQLLDNSVAANNGLLIYDLSDIQARRPNPNVKEVSRLMWKDGSTAQHTIHVMIKNKPYLVFVDEAGAGGNAVNTRQAACDAGMYPYPLARIIDIADDTKPRVISKLALEIHDPANCEKVTPDLVGLTSFLYGAHYCSVDNIRKATTLACGYLNSGIRVFDIRDPIRPREIAYYNPAATPNVSAGSNHIAQRATQQPGGPDWCSAQVHMDAERGTLWTTCQDNGLVSLKFTHNAWPFAESTTPPGLQN